MHVIKKILDYLRNRYVSIRGVVSVSSGRRRPLRVSSVLLLLIALLSGATAAVSGAAPVKAATAARAKAPASPKTRPVKLHQTTPPKNVKPGSPAYPSATAPKLPASATGTVPSKAAAPAKTAAPSIGAKSATASPKVTPAMRAAAVQKAIGSSAVPDTCSGEISPDTVYPCSSPIGNGNTYTLSVPDSNDVLFIDVESTVNSAYGSLTLTAPDGSKVTCQSPKTPYASGLQQCSTSQSGTYTLLVGSSDTDFTVSYMPLLSDTTCAAADPSFSSPVLTGSFAAGQVGTCYTLNAAPGDVLHYNMGVGMQSSTGVVPWIFDATGTRQCYNPNVDGDYTIGDCKLSGTGPYRVLISQAGIAASSYQITMNGVANPAGCQAVAQQAYGQTPDQGTDRCRTLTVAKPGKYDIGVDSSSQFDAMSLYTSAGDKTCVVTESSLSDCDLDAGTYAVVVDDNPVTAQDNYGVTFIAADETQGCTATGDTDFATGPATGSFSGTDEEICLTLPTASGQDDYIFNQAPSSGAATPNAQVVDATGAAQCPQENGMDACVLNGTAPFRIILSNSGSASSATQYRLIVQNTASTAGCSTWSQSGMGDSYGATASFPDANTIDCLAIPAGQHSTGEMIDSTDADGSGGQAWISVNDPTGKEACTGTEAIGCQYQAATTYTAIVTNGTAGHTYNLARRDVSQTATCGTPASTTVGGASTTFGLNSFLDTACYRLSPAATDKLWINARTSAPDGGYDWLEVTDASGTPVCYTGGGSGPCELTGDTDYQVIMIPEYYAGVAVTTHLDTWTVGNASGWASQCTQNHYSAETGWGPVSGTLTESAAGHCATVDVKPNDKFTIYEGGVTKSDLVNGDVLSSENWNSTSGVQNDFCTNTQGASYSAQWLDCQVPSSQTAETAVMIVYPGRTFPGSVSTPTPYTLQSDCLSIDTCASKAVNATVSKISATSGTAGPGNALTVTGTGLTLGDELFLEDSNGTHVATAADQSVNSAGTSLATSLDATGVAAGKYSVELVDQYGMTVSAGSYTVNAAPTPSLSGFTPVTQTQIMSKSLAKGSTTNVGVGGNGGVPSSGATSAKLEITVTNPSTAGSITVYPGSSTKTSTTALNFNAGQTQTDMVDVQLGSGVELYNGAGGALNVTVDTVGYYSSGGASYTPLPEGRILNSTSVASKTTKEINVGGNGGVPSSGASSVALEVTESGAAAAGSAVVYPNGSARPTDPDLSFAKGQSVTEMAIGKLGTGLLVYNNSGGAANFTVNVVGYYSTSGSKFHPITPDRILDTRNAIGDSGNQGVLAGGATRTLLTDSMGIPSKAKAVVVDVTALSPQAAGSLFAFPDNAIDPTGGQDLSFSGGGKATGLVVIPLTGQGGQPSGTVDVHNNSGGTVQIVGDLEGYYA